MPISDIVNVSISIASPGFPRVGYGIPLILSTHVLNADLVRSYSNLDGMVADGFVATGPEYLCASMLFAQNPKPRTIMVGRLANRHAKSVRLTPIAAHLTTYTVNVNDIAASYTSDASATVAEITAGLEAAINALAISGLTTTDNGTSLDLSVAAGGWFGLEVSPEMTTRLTVLDTTSDAGVAADLAAIKVVNNDWYAILSLHNSKAISEAIATFAESNVKLYLANTIDSACLNTTFSGTDDIGESLKASGKLRTALFYHPADRQFFSAAEAGLLLPKDPGSAAWSDKTLSGPEYYTLTTTQRTNLQARNAQIYERIGDVGRTRGGKVSGGEWIDVIITRDALTTNIQAAVYDVISGSDKLPYDDNGIAAVQSAILGELFSGTVSVRSGALAADPAPVCTVPLAADVSSVDKAARTLNGVKFDAVLSGAILTTNISGALTA